jgi:hypothetical protein
MSTLLSWVLVATASLAPNRAHEPLARAITAIAEREAPLFRDDEDRKKTVAFLVAVAFRESSLRPDAVGDLAGKDKATPTSFCAYQIHLPWGRKTEEGWSGDDLAQDAEKCVTVAHRMMQESARVCPAYPLAWYAEGPQGCTSARAQRISRDRMALAQRLLKQVTLPAAPPASSEPAGTRASDVVGRGYATPGPRHMCSP